MKFISWFFERRRIKALCKIQESIAYNEGKLIHYSKFRERPWYIIEEEARLSGDTQRLKKRLEIEQGN